MSIPATMHRKTQTSSLIYNTFDDPQSRVPAQIQGRRLSWVDIENQENCLFLKINTALIVALYSLGVFSYIKGLTCNSNDTVETIAFTWATMEAMILLCFIIGYKLDKCYKSENEQAEPLQGRVKKIEKNYDRSIWALALAISLANLCFGSIATVTSHFRRPNNDVAVEACRFSQIQALWGYLGIGVIGTAMSLVWQKHLGKIKL